MTKIKVLSRAQIKTIREMGLDIAGVSPVGTQQELKQKTVQLFEWIFDNCYPELSQDDSIGYDELLEIAGKTYTKTYGRDVEVKN